MHLDYWGRQPGLMNYKSVCEWKSK